MSSTIADLLEHHLALELEVGLAQQRGEDEIADHVGRDVEVLVEHARLIDGVLARGVGVERAAERLQLQRDLLRGRGAPCP